MADDDRILSIDDLAEQTGTPVRTIRFYIAEGLLPGPGARGKAAAYGPEHLLRLRLIRQLTEQRRPLAEIRARIGGLTPQEVEELLEEEQQRSGALRRAEQSASPKEYLATLLQRAQEAREGGTSRLAQSAPSASALSQAAQQQEQHADALAQRPAALWQRWEAAPGVEIHIRTDVLQQDRPLVERLLALAHTLFGRKRRSDRSEPPGP